MAAIFMLVATMLMTVGYRLVSNSSRQSKERMLYVGEAENVARAGLVDTLGWFSRRTSNGGLVAGAVVTPVIPGSTPTPVYPYTNIDQAFSPQNNTANAQLSDTIDASIGIVKEYPLDSPVTANALYWARYEVKQQGTGAFDPNAVHDVTGERIFKYADGSGYVWNIVSTGYVYKRMDKSIDPTTGNFAVSMTQPPNSVVATARFSTEFRKLSLVMPCPTPGNVNGVAGAIYVQNIKNQVTLSNTQTYISANAPNCFGVVGMHSP